MSEEQPEKFDISQLSEDELCRMAFGRGQYSDWYKTRGFNIDIILSNSWDINSYDKKVEYSKKIIEVIETIGPDKLEGKFINFLPNTNKIGEQPNWSKTGKDFILGLDASVDQLVGAIRDYTLKDE